MYPITNLLIKPEDLLEVEQLRREVYNIENSDISNYLHELKEKTIYAYGTKIDNKIVAGGYFNVSYNILYIKQLFVKQEYQNTGLKLGRNILYYMFNNKYEIEKLTGKTIDSSMIYPTSIKSLKIYRDIGYKNLGDDFSMMIKSI